jgi:YVTN family beta-propeller protein
MTIDARAMSIRGGGGPLYRGARCCLCLAFLFLPAVSAIAGSGETDTPAVGREPQRIVQEGIAVETSITPLAGEQKEGANLLEGEDALVRFRITDAATGTPMAGLHPSAWMDARTGDSAADPKVCREKVQSFLKGSLNARPEVDLNTYYVLALNQESNISVIDPLLSFGSSKLLTLVLLKSPGEDWVLSRDGQRLFVTMPLVNQVAVVDTATWKVVANVDAGSKPTRLVLQPDGKYLWVGNDGVGDGGVTAIEANAFKVAARIRTGAGHHELAFSDDSRFAFVTNAQDGTLSIIDVSKLAKLKDLKVGSRLAGLAFSPLSKAIYVISEGQGTIAVVDGQKLAVLARIKARPGLRAIRVVPDGRWGFVANWKENTVSIFDASTNRILHTVDVGKGPEQIIFTRDYAYVRSAGTEEVAMIPVAALGKGGSVVPAKFPGGQLPPEKATRAAAADAMVPTPEGNAILVANPADKVIYYYSEGMAAPMGSFQNYRREPRAVLVADRSIRETAPGVYSTTVRLTRSGRYDVAFLLDAPQILHCFDLAVQPNPRLMKRAAVALKVEPLIQDRKIRVGENFRLQFKVSDMNANQPKVGLKDVAVLAALAAGTWQTRAVAQPVGEGIYEVAFTPPKAGVYYVFFQVPSLGLRFDQLPSLILHAVEGGVPSTGAVSEKKDEGGK